VKRKGREAEAAREPATAELPASVPARAQDEEAIVEAWESRPSLERPPRWQVGTDGQLEPAGDPALTVIRTARIFHAQNLDHAAQTFVTLANALGQIAGGKLSGSVSRLRRAVHAGLERSSAAQRSAPWTFSSEINM
jgi:hypothetical protein